MDILNNREIAILFWFAVATVIVAVKTDLRKMLSPVFKCLLNRIILSVLFLFLSYVGFMIFCLEGWGLWDSVQVKNTIIWTSVVGLVAVFKMVGADKNTFFEDWIFDNFKIAFVLGFIVSFYTFHILIELILQPFIVFITMISAFSENKKEHKAVNALCDWILVIICLYVLWWSGNKIWDDPYAFFTFQTVQDFSTPIILSLAFTPFLYVLFLYMTYERIFLTLGNVTDDKKLQRYMKWNAVLSFGADTDFLQRWKREIHLKDPKNKQEVRRIVSDLLELKKIENNPPVIPENEGWSPYVAQKFLVEHGILVGDYHKGYNDEWVSYSNGFDVGEEIILSDTVTYYIYGDKRAARQLQLNLYISNPENCQKSKETFQSIAQTLFEKATKQNVPEEFLSVVKAGQGEMIVNDFINIMVSKDEWDVGERKNYEIKITFEIIS